MRGKKLGFSLVEVTMSSAVLAIVAAGITSVTVMTNRIAYENVYKNTAHTVAQAYGEQIKSIDYAVLRQALKDPSSKFIPTESLALGAGKKSEDLKEADPLIFGVPVAKDVIVDVENKKDGTLDERIMKMWFTVNGQEMQDASECWNAMEISIDYEWEFAGRSGTNRRTGQVLLIRTSTN